MRRATNSQPYRRLLAELQFHGATVMIDAMGGHPSSASQIQDGGADYLLALKANEKETHQVVAAHFESLRPTQAAQAAGGQVWAYGCKVSTPASKTNAATSSAKLSCSER
jgi:hypothetical protein